MRHRFIILMTLLILVQAKSVMANEGCDSKGNDKDNSIEMVLARAGSNRDQIEDALNRVPEDQRKGMCWLITHMPDRDLQSLNSEYLLENCELAYKAFFATPWGNRIPEDIFLDSVLPYANVSERRDRWRAEFHRKFTPLVADAKTPSEAAVILNRKIYSLINVKYSAQCARADQSPYESIDSGFASCTGLSILLINACRSVGVPARFVGTPLWVDGSGNHSWVEIWDDGWHFTGAAEPTGDELNQAWFTDRAARAYRSDPEHAIYAVTWRKTPITFPMSWQPADRSTYAVDITDRYTTNIEQLPLNMARVRFRVINETTGKRCNAAVSVLDDTGSTLFEGTSKDERFDTNDHLTAILPLGERLRLKASYNEQKSFMTFTVKGEAQLITVRIQSSE